LEKARTSGVEQREQQIQAMAVMAIEVGLMRVALVVAEL
jgi:hypothetical protein